MKTQSMVKRLFKIKNDLKNDKIITGLMQVITRIEEEYELLVEIDPLRTSLKECEFYEGWVSRIDSRKTIEDQILDNINIILDINLKIIERIKNKYILNT